MERILDDGTVRQLKDFWGEIPSPINLLLFVGDEDCTYCDETLQLLKELSEIEPKIHLSRYNLDKDQEMAAQYHVDKKPTIVLAGQIDGKMVDYGIRFVGIPAGHEFTSLVNDIAMIGKADSGLGGKTRDFLKALDKPVKLQVFVTPTCPYCPQAVVLAHRMALESPLVEAEMIEATEFPELSDRYGVNGVPHTAINEGAGTLIGAAPEERLVFEIQNAIQGSAGGR